MVRLLLFYYLRRLTGEGFSTPKQTLPEREMSFGKPSINLLSVPVSDSRLAQGVLDLVKGYVGFQFQGLMELYNETPRVSPLRSIQDIRTH